MSSLLPKRSKHQTLRRQIRQVLVRSFVRWYVVETQRHPLIDRIDRPLSADPEISSSIFVKVDPYFAVVSLTHTAHRSAWIIVVVIFGPCAVRE